MLNVEDESGNVLFLGFSSVTAIISGLLSSIHSSKAVSLFVRQSAFVYTHLSDLYLLTLIPEELVLALLICGVSKFTDSIGFGWLVVAEGLEKPVCPLPSSPDLPPGVALAGQLPLF